MDIDRTLISKRMQPITGSAIREIFHLLAQPGMISFAGGNPSNAALRPDVVAELAADVLARRGTELLQYGATEGFLPLRESVAEFLRGAGILAEPHQILPTQGGQQAFDLLLNALIDPGDVVLVESPTFLGALQGIRKYGARIVSVPTDDEGVIPAAAEEAIKAHRPKLLYVIPTFQNPTGVTLTLNRRKELAALCEKYALIIAEDDPYRDVRYTGESLPAIKSFDQTGRVVYLSSFSKLIAPGLRVGTAVVSDPALMRKMVIGKQSADVHSPLLTQAIVDAFLRRGLMGPHLARVAEGYRAQLAAMLKGFEHFPDGVSHTTPEGGLFVWGRMPEGVDATALLKTAVGHNVAYVPGEHFYQENGPKHTFRLNFSNSDVDAIERGMQTLGRLASEAVK